MQTRAAAGGISSPPAMLTGNRTAARVLLHVLPLFVILLSTFPSFVARTTPPSLQLFPGLLIFPVIVAAYYLHYLVVIPRLLFQRKFAFYAGSAIGLAIAAGVVCSILQLQWLPYTGPEPIRVMPNGELAPPQQGVFQPSARGVITLFSIVRMVAVVGLGLAIATTVRWFRQERQYRETQQEQLKTELTMLKNQLNPHFFFNTLNSIYALTETDPKQAREITHRLSKLMRYLLYETDTNDRVPLSSELAFLRTYMELMRARMPETVAVSMETHITDDSVALPPLLFVPFVENAFKHGISLQEECSIRVLLEQADTGVSLVVQNTIPKQRLAAAKSTGTGLINIRRRLELLYGTDNYELDVVAGPSTFDVHLSLPNHAA